MSEFVLQAFILRPHLIRRTLWLLSMPIYQALLFTLKITKSSRVPGLFVGLLIPCILTALINQWFLSLPAAVVILELCKAGFAAGRWRSHVWAMVRQKVEEPWTIQRTMRIYDECSDSFRYAMREPARDPSRRGQQTGLAALRTWRNPSSGYAGLQCAYLTMVLVNPEWHMVCKNNFTDAASQSSHAILLVWVFLRQRTIWHELLWPWFSHLKHPSSSNPPINEYFGKRFPHQMSRTNTQYAIFRKDQEPLGLPVVLTGIVHKGVATTWLLSTKILTSTSCRTELVNWRWPTRGNWTSLI